MGLLDHFRTAPAQKAGAVPLTGPARTIKVVKDGFGRPAVDLSKVHGHVNLTKSAEAAGFSLQKRGLAGIRAKVMLMVDHSGSMSRDYASGHVQTLVERALGTALQIDAGGEIPVFPWDHDVRRPTAATVGNYQGIVDRELWHRHDMGSTDLAKALKVVLQAAQTTELPLYACIATDGNPDDKREATEVICELSRYPVFIKFLALRPVSYLDELDNLGPSVRLVDNVNAQPHPDNPIDLLACSDAEFQEAMVEEWDAWFKAATGAGILQ